MSIAGIRDAIKAGLEAITGLTAFDTVPDSINKLPAAWVLPLSASYDLTASNSSMVLHCVVVVMLGRQGDIQAAQDTLDTYILPTGSTSVKAALEATNLSSHADVLRVTGFRDYGGMEFGGQQYIGCKFDVDVWI